MGVLVGLTLLSAGTFALCSRRGHAELAQSAKSIAAIAGFIVLIAIVVRDMVKTWLDQKISGFPDIDDAWHEGHSALTEAGYKLGELPLFVVLGIPEEGAAKSLMAAATLGVDVIAVPAGEPAPLRWFAGPNCIVLICAILTLAVMGWKA